MDFNPCAFPVKFKNGTKPYIKFDIILLIKLDNIIDTYKIIVSLNCFKNPFTYPKYAPNKITNKINILVIV